MPLTPKNGPEMIVTRTLEEYTKDTGLPLYLEWAHPEGYWLSDQNGDSQAGSFKKLSDVRILIGGMMLHHQRAERVKTFSGGGGAP